MFVYLNLLSIFEEDTISGWLLRAKAYRIRFGLLSPLCSHTTVRLACTLSGLARESGGAF
jgi:hypothetical protein